MANYERQRLPATLRAAVYRQHGYVCHLCGKAIDPSLRFPDPFSASVDHLVPVSHGGADHLDNLLPAHLGCNSLRSNRELDTHRAGMIVSTLTRDELLTVVSTKVPVKFGSRFYQPFVEDFSPRWYRFQALDVVRRNARLIGLFIFTMLLMIATLGVGATALYFAFRYAPLFTFWALLIGFVVYRMSTSRRRYYRKRGRRGAKARQRYRQRDLFINGLRNQGRTRARIIDATQRPRPLTARERYLARHIVEWEELAETPLRYLIPGVGLEVREALDEQ